MGDVTSRIKLRGVTIFQFLPQAPGNILTPGHIFRDKMTLAG